MMNTKNRKRINEKQAVELLNLISKRVLMEKSILLKEKVRTKSFSSIMYKTTEVFKLQLCKLLYNVPDLTFDTVQLSHHSNCKHRKNV